MNAEASDKLVWRSLSRVDLIQLKEARLQAHHAVQWLARAARAYALPQPDDGHTSLQWDDGLDGFITHPLEDGSRLRLRINALDAGTAKRRQIGKCAIAFVERPLGRASAPLAR